MADMMRTGLAALTASQRALATASHNIANANTTGYTRQRVELASRRPEYVGGGANPQFIGNGVDVTSINRVYNSFLTEQTRNYGSSVGQLETKDRWISQLDGVLGDGSTGLAPAVKQFFASAQDVANSPASLPARQALLGQAETLAGQFNALDGKMNVLRDGVNQELSGAVTTINGLAENIAKANQAITLSPGGGNHAAPDLLDQRDQLVAQLAEKVAVNTVIQSDGSMSVFIGNGQNLVMGLKANMLETKPSPADPRKLDIQFKQGSSVITDAFSTGEVGGLLAFQNQVLDPAQNKLGLMAAGLAQTFNDQHELGMDLNGVLGGDFFNSGVPTVGSNANNTGTGAFTATITNIGKVQPSDYEIKYDGANYSAVRVSDQKTILGSGNLAALNTALGNDGLSLTLTGSPAIGDRFLVQPVRTAATDFGVKIKDPNLFAAAAPIKTSADQDNSGTGKISAGEALDAANANLLTTVNIQFTDATHYTVNGVASATTYASGEDIDINGWRIQLTGAPATGDKFQVSSNTGGVGDNRNGLKLNELQTGKKLLNGTSTYQDMQSQMVSEVGAQGSATSSTLKTQEALQEQAIQARDNVSGVNLDEEAANLMKYQRSYEAAAKVVQIGDSLIQTLLGMLGR